MPAPKLTGDGRASPKLTGDADADALDRAMARETRRVRRLSRIGTGAYCIVCGETRWQCLEIHEPAGRIAGKVRDAVAVVLCRNCHAVATELQLDHSCEGDGKGRLLHGIADLLTMVAAELEKGIDNPPKNHYI
jgi:hypothetical protein